MFGFDFNVIRPVHVLIFKIKTGGWKGDTECGHLSSTWKERCAYLVNQSSTWVRNEVGQLRKVQNS